MRWLKDHDNSKNSNLSISEVIEYSSQVHTNTKGLKLRLKGQSSAIHFKIPYKKHSFLSAFCLREVNKSMSVLINIKSEK